MKTNDTNKKKSSAAKKLVPAVAMLTTSAVMLASATYAWFTLNKEVEVTGLSMSATTSDALEISLGARGEDAGSKTIANENGVAVQPTDKDVSWTNKEVIGSYYKEVGKLKPASSADAISFFNAGDVKAGGRSADNFTEVTAKAKLNIQDTYTSTSNIETLATTENSGYYIDVPVWLRTSKLQGQDTDGQADIYCAIKISRKTPAGEGTSTEDELYKAVRVAFIPATGSDGNALTAPSSNTGATVYGVSDVTYSGDKTVVKAAGSRANATLGAPSPAIVTTTQTGDVYLTSKMEATIPYATTDSYGEQQFIVRVWLEGEDVNCWDKTSNQDWNIDFAFSLSEFNTSDNKPTFAKAE